MALDTRKKRASAISLQAWSVVLPAPSGTIDQSVRSQLAYVYWFLAAAPSDRHGHLLMVWSIPNTVMDNV